MTDLSDRAHEYGHSALAQVFKRSAAAGGKGASALDEEGYLKEEWTERRNVLAGIEPGKGGEAAEVALKV